MFLPQPKITFDLLREWHPTKAIHGHAPGLAGDPPTIRLFGTVEKPHPCAGVNNCPFGAELSRFWDSETKKIEILTNISPKIILIYFKPFGKNTNHWLLLPIQIAEPLQEIVRNSLLLCRIIEIWYTYSFIE